MYATWLQNPNDVHSSWASYFKQVQNNAPPGAAHQSPPAGVSKWIF